MKNMTVKVKGMHCSSCEMLIQDAVSDIDGVNSVEASTKKGIVSVSYDDSKTDDTEIRKAIESEGYTIV